MWWKVVIPGIPTKKDVGYTPKVSSDNQVSLGKERIIGFKSIYEIILLVCPQGGGFIPFYDWVVVEVEM